MTHELKIHPQYFKDVMLGLKHFEIRYNDRGFREGDVVILKEWDGDSLTYTGKYVKRVIFNVYHSLPGLEQGYVIFQMRKLLL